MEWYKDISEKARKKFKKEKLIYIVLLMMIISFIISTIISVNSINTIENKENTNTATLLADNIYNEIYMELQKHVAVGRTMASSTEIQYILENEDSYTDQEMEAVTGKILERYASNLGCNTVFLVSMASRRYYTQDGFNKVVDIDNDEHDIWLKNFLDTGKDYAFDIDIDEAHEKTWTIFINNRVYSDDGKLIGICGIGTQMANMQDILKKIQDTYDISVAIVDENGIVQVDMDEMNLEKTYYNFNGQVIDQQSEEIQYVEERDGYLATKFMKDLGWSLLIHHKLDTKPIVVALIIRTIFVMALVFAVFVVVVTYVIKREEHVTKRNAVIESYGKLAAFYDAMYILSLKHDGILKIKSSLHDYSELIDENKDFRSQIENLITTLVSDEYVERVKWFFNFSNIKKRFEKKISYSIDFLTKQRGWLRVRLIAMKGSETGNVDHLIVVFEDIDEERRKEETLRLETDAAKAASEAKGRFLANMSHEIRTPINAVLGMDTMILRECKEPQIKEYAMSIHNAGNILLSLINDILDISKIESGKMEIVPAKYDFSTLIYDVVNMISSKAESKGLELNIDLDNSLPSGLFGDDVRIRQIIVNLMNNAVKYTEKGSVTLTVGGDVEADSDRVNLHISVKDTGIGIKPEDMPKLSEEFIRIEESRNRNIEGTGLGMGITIQLLELMDSKLEVSSVYGEGSTFSFDLKQQVESYEPIGDINLRLSKSAESFTYESLFTAPDANILIVDDNPVNRIVFRNLLKETEVNIDEADGGFAALDMTMDKVYDIIFLDHMMPDLNGVEVMKQIKGNNEHPNINTPVIVLTANAISGAKEKYLAAGFNDYLSKPIIPADLERLMDKLLPDDKKREGRKVRVSECSQADAERMDLPMVEGIDWNYARLHFSDDDALLATLKGFAKTIELEADKLYGFYKQIIEERMDSEGATPSNDEALDLYRVNVHAMKSTATLLGFVPLAGMAATLEYAARDGRLALIRDMTPHFLNSWMDYKEKLAFANEEEASKQEIVDKSLIIDYINILKETIQNFDVHGADNALEELCKYQYESEVEGIMSKMPAAVTNLDVDLVVSLCDDMLVYF